MKKNKIGNFFPTATIISIFLFINSTMVSPQNMAIKTEYHGFLDNREYFNDYSEHQTFFGNNINIFTSLEKKNARVNIGFNYIYEFGAINNRFKPKLIANFNYTDKKLLFNIGSFQRKGILNYPLALLTDSLEYYRPLMEGTLIRWKFNRGFQQTWIDWTSRQTDTIRETFMAGLSGHFEIGNFHVNNYVLMYHYAKPAINPNNLHIRDNGGICLEIGYQYQPSSFFALNFLSGEIMSYDRNRGEYDLRTYYSTYGGVICDIKRFSVGGKYYFGDGVVSMNGEKIYAAPHYARFDLKYGFLKQNPDNILAISIHLVEGKLNYSQLISLRFNFEIEQKRGPFEQLANKRDKLIPSD